MNKKIYFTLAITALVLLSICLIYARQIILPEGVYVNQTRNTEGTLSFTVRTVTYGGSYAPRNVGAIWITNSSNQFVKTIKVWAQSYRNTLVKWLLSSSNNTTGAITGATLTTHQLHTVSWNGTNASGTQVADGEYRINVEFSEHNATTSNPGKYKFIAFAKGSTLVDTTPTSDSYFTNMHLTWTPSTPTYGILSGTITNNAANPIENATVTIGTQTATTNAAGVYRISNIPTGTYSVSCSALNYSVHTQSNVIITNNQTTTLNFNMGNPANGILSGTVFNGLNNTPIPGATVSIGAITTTTNASGNYSISLLPGTFSVDCSAPSFNTMHQSNVSILSNQTTTLNFYLAVTSIDDQTIPIQHTSLLINYPNPFNDRTQISYYLDKNSVVNIKIYNTKGQLVKSYPLSSVNKGIHKIEWDARDDYGRHIRNGNYIVKMYADGSTFSKSLIYKR